jgi:hypothetical protein
LRDNAAIQLQTLQLGKEVKYLSSKEAKQAMDIALFAPVPLERMWGYWTARVKNGMMDMR